MTTPTTPDDGQREVARELTDDELNAIEIRAKRAPKIGPLVVALRGEDLWNDTEEISGEDTAYLFCDIAYDDIPALLSEVRRLRAALAAQRREAQAEQMESSVKSVLALKENVRSGPHYERDTLFNKTLELAATTIRVAYAAAIRAEMEREP